MTSVENTLVGANEALADELDAILGEETADAAASEGITVPDGEIAVLDGKTGLIQPRRRRGSLEKRRARAGYAFTAPFILGVILIYLPILLDSLWLSLSVFVPNQVGGFDLELVWFDNYISAFTTSGTTFIPALVGGIQELIFQVPAIIIFSLFIAVVLNQKMLGRAAFRAIFFVPVIISTGIMEAINATQVSANGIDDGSGGGAGDIISSLDLQMLFANMKVGGELVTYVVTIVNDVYQIINYSGVQMLIFLAGLQSISPSIYEACRIDGATGWETFWKVTFPMISPMILVNLVYTVIDAFTRSESITMKYIMESAYESNNNLGTAMAWIYFFVVILIIAAVAGIVSTFIFYQRKD